MILLSQIQVVCWIFRVCYTSIVQCILYNEQLMLFIPFYVIMLQNSFECCLKFKKHFMKCKLHIRCWLQNPLGCWFIDLFMMMCVIMILLTNEYTCVLEICAVHIVDVECLLYGCFILCIVKKILHFILSYDNLTHWGLVTPYGDRDLGQHWLR